MKCIELMKEVKQREQKINEGYVMLLKEILKEESKETKEVVKVLVN